MPTYEGSYVQAASYNRVRAEFVATLRYPGGSLTADDTYVDVDWTARLRKHPNDASGSSCSDTSDYSVEGLANQQSSKAWSLGSPGATATIASGTVRVTLTYSSQSKSIWFAADHRVLSGVPKVDGTLTIPARPVNAPAPVTGLTVTRVSDTRQTLSWTNNGSSGAPYASVEVWRRHVTGSGSSVPYARVASLDSSSWSGYTDTATRADRLYSYRVRAVNAAGQSDWAQVDVSTTPAAPSSPGVTKSPSGDVVVTVRGLSSAATGWRVWDRPDGGAAVLVSGSSPLSASQSTWTHTGASPSQTHAYQVQAVSSSPVLYSALGPVSATVQLLAPPNAPTNLGPTSGRDAGEAATLTWRHNPVDMTAQTYYEVRYRLQGTSTWTYTGAVASGTSQHTFAAGTFTNGDRVEWQVRTHGAYTSAPSPFSATAVLVYSTRPVAGITSPTHGGSWATPRLTVTWTYFDLEASAQSAWVVSLYRDGTLLERRDGTTSATRSVTFDTAVADGTYYAVAVTVRDGAWVWSDTATASFTVTYQPPPTPTLAVQWHADDGYATLAVDVPAPVGGERPVASLRVERATASGWVLVTGADVLTSWPTTVVDMTPPLGQAVQYRAVAVSDIGSEAYSPVAVVETRTRWVFLNFGPGFGQVVRVWGNLQAGRTYGRAKALHQFVGRSLPVERAGGHVTRTYSLTARLFAPWLPPDETSTWADVEALADADAPVCVRDPEGVRLFCSVGDVSLDGHLEASRTASIPLTVVDWVEP